MRFILADTDQRMINAWKDSFADLSNFEYYHGNILNASRSRSRSRLGTVALVSPANSFGDMSGGVDLSYSIAFGQVIEDNVIQKIKKDKYGELVVGDAVITSLPENKYGFNLLISAPTMRTPKQVTGTLNAYLAFRAVLIQVSEWNHRHGPDQQITTVICPGLATGFGKIPALKVAQQMREAYDNLKSDGIR